MKRSYRAWMLVLILAIVAAPALCLADFTPETDFQAFLYRLGETGAMNYGNFLVKYLPWFGLQDADRVFLYGQFAGLPYDSAKWNAWLVGFEAEMVP